MDNLILLNRPTAKPMNVTGQYKKTAKAQKAHLILPETQSRPFVKPKEL